MPDNGNDLEFFTSIECKFVDCQVDNSLLFLTWIEEC